MAIVAVNKNVYKVDSLYQWDVNQVLEIHGLSVPKVPEIHFTNEAMEKALIRQANMDDAGVITVEIPNSLLQKPYKITAYVCMYEDETFESLYKITIPVKARNMPTDYTIQDNDGELYSFNEMENKVENALLVMTEQHEESKTTYNEAVELLTDSETNFNNAIEELNEAKSTYENAETILEEAKTEANEAKETYEEMKRKYFLVTATLYAGETRKEIPFGDSLTSNSILSVYTSVYGVNPKDVYVNVINGMGSTVVLIFEAQENDIKVGVRIDG